MRFFIKNINLIHICLCINSFYSYSIQEDIKSFNDSIIKYKNGDYQKAIEFGYAALDLIKDKEIISLDFVNTNYYIGETLYYLGDYKTSFEYLSKSLELYDLLKPKQRRNKLVTKPPWVLVIMGNVYFSNDDFSNENFKWLSAKQVDVGFAPVNAMRVNFVGELGWELHHPIEYQNHIFDKLMDAGQDLGLKPYGIRAMNSLRVEKSYKLVGTELSIEYSPYESGLDRFIHPNKGSFIGLDALNKWREKGFDNKLVTLEVHETSDADVLGNNPIYENGSVVGRATGGDFGFRLGKSIALGMVKPELANVGQKLRIDILGKMHEATILEESPYDAENKLLRA